MEAKCTRLEKELEERSVDKLDGEEEDNATSHQVGRAPKAVARKVERAMISTH